MGSETHPSFHLTLVFSLLDEFSDAFDQGFANGKQHNKNKASFSIHRSNETTGHCKNGKNRAMEFKVALIGTGL